MHCKTAALLMDRTVRLWWSCRNRNMIKNLKYLFIFVLFKVHGSIWRVSDRIQANAMLAELQLASWVAKVREEPISSSV